MRDKKNIIFYGFMAVAILIIGIWNLSADPGDGAGPALLIAVLILIAGLVGDWVSREKK